MFPLPDRPAEIAATQIIFSKFQQEKYFFSDFETEFVS